MEKTYKSSTVLSIVTTKTKKRITFDELSGGNGSIYTTKDEKLMQEIEEHPMFGSRFWIKSVTGDKATETSKPAKKAEEAAEMKTVPISDPGDAKEYLCEHFGDLSRTQLKTREAIIAVAKTKGIIFEGL